jgi:serine protease
LALQKQYSTAFGNLKGAQFAIPDGQYWYNPKEQHGTHITGTIIAQGGNNKGTVGVIPSNQGICLLISRIFDDTGKSASFAAVGQGIEWCAKNGARVINMSIGGPQRDPATEELIKTLARNQNILLVAAAGNTEYDGDGDKFPYFYPASFTDVISVAAVDSSLDAYYSQINNEVDLSGPGVNVLSSVPGNAYDTWEGTSSATAFVTGAIAKIWAARPQCTNLQVRQAVERTARDLSAPGRDDSTGYGLVQIKAAYLVSAEPSCPLASLMRLLHWPLRRQFFPLYLVLR